MNRLSEEPSPKTIPFKFATPAATGVDQDRDAGRRGIGLHQAPECEAPVASFVPLNYEANYAYPLVVWLHGCGQSERDLPQVMRHVSTRNHVAVAPRGTYEYPDQPDAYTWNDTARSVEQAEDRVFNAIQQTQQRLSVHPQRVFIAGLGSGGGMAMRLAMLHPQAFAGAAAFDSGLPTGRNPLSRINDFRLLPILLAGSRESQAYPEQRLCNDLRLLHACGSTVSVRQYPGSDDLTTAMLADFDRWLMEIVCGAAAQV